MNPLEANDPWEWLWAIISWGLWLLCLAGALIILFAILVGIWRSVRGILPQASGIRRKTIQDDSLAVSETLYGGPFTGSATAFRAGVDWTLRSLERKPK
ncbi:hypothetical protein PBI_MARTIN_51 [Microbacterium phage Martin]|uniref:Uncharacterized protein n=60 Tax=Ilzatvirus TaxID=2560150 RepID=A0A5J6TFA1_9CAUD|nr:hypothetical protein H3N90_gp50 [Microbacterium phage Teagan]AUX82636.1 hypothetical protein PBI_AUBERGINE_49 [Microbacterium phage Aubergine]AUX82699.1 hypothetical protein PBI_AXIPUP_50 [Microbacterium phage AxiPup]AUX82761.1 hypothetical protein PBI_BAINES_49 [Microbacterium phage Baines]AUX82823.1 hypothetical protein PBI_ESPINOSA_49 [Microbacterium phage Espinosa]AUX82948.1 hypothetical protein PBI_KALE_49 [Microbacterium phage Kale]AUX83011.1 hypothetical protein PBI_KNOX_50 [Microba